MAAPVTSGPWDGRLDPAELMMSAEEWAQFKSAWADAQADDGRAAVLGFLSLHPMTAPDLTHQIEYACALVGWRMHEGPLPRNKLVFPDDPPTPHAPTPTYRQLKRRHEKAQKEKKREREAQARADSGHSGVAAHPAHT